MFLDTADFSTIWKLAHNWTGHDPEQADEKNLPDEVKQATYRILSAIAWNYLSVRTRNRLILEDDSIMTLLFDWRFIVKNYRCLKKGVFDKNHLDSMYVKRSEVIAWCEKDYLPIPDVWRKSLPSNGVVHHAQTDDKDDGWYESLTEIRKQKVVCLQIAKQLWEENPNQTYEEIYKHPVFVRYANPKVFTFESFKKWSRRYATEYATAGGRPTKTKQL